jgi:hypothetical protein
MTIDQILRRTDLALATLLVIAFSTPAWAQVPPAAAAQTHEKQATDEAERSDRLSKPDRPEAGDAAPTPSFYYPVHQQIEGWSVAVDPRLLADEHQEVASRAFQALANHLQRIEYIVPADRLAQMQQLRIWIELDNPKLSSMQYHPNRGWLVAHGHDPRLVKHVHIPRAKHLFARHMWAKHPYVVLHELAHAYHDQVLGFDHADVLAAYKEMKAERSYEQVLLYTGAKVRHYGLTDHKEYFAESTEAYFGVNDFYPFVRAELKEHDPGMFSLMEKIWGRVE